MTCKEFIEFLMEYLGATLPSEERAHFEYHLGQCPDCLAYLDMYEKTVKLGKAAFANECNGIPADVPADLIRAILAARQARPDSSPA